MRRQEAERLIGTRVEAWTAMNGIYVGTLEEVFGSPWRGRVRITGVLKPAVVYDLTRGHQFARQRRGFRPGQMIEVGNSSIKPTEAPGESYLAALQRELRYFKEWQARPFVDPKDARWLPIAIDNLRQAVAAEEQKEASSGAAGEEACAPPNGNALSAVQPLNE